MEGGFKDYKEVSIGKVHNFYASPKPVYNKRYLEAELERNPWRMTFLEEDLQGVKSRARNEFDYHFASDTLDESLKM